MRIVYNYDEDLDQVKPTRTINSNFNASAYLKLCSEMLNDVQSMVTSVRDALVLKQNKKEE